MAYLIAPLGDRLGHTHEVYLLEGVCAEGRDGHLSGNDDNRRGVHHSIGDARQCVGNAGAAGDKGHAHLPTHTGIALSGMGCRLLVAYQDMVETFLLATGIVEERVVDGHDGTSGIAEDGFHLLRLKGPHQRFGACYSVFKHIPIFSSIPSISSASSR